MPAGLRRHAVYFDEEIRISRRIEDMAEAAFALSPKRDEILRSVRRLSRSVEARRRIMEDLDESLKDQENRLMEYMDLLRSSQRK